MLAIVIYVSQVLSCRNINLFFLCSLWHVSGQVNSNMGDLENWKNLQKGDWKLWLDKRGAEGDLQFLLGAKGCWNVFWWEIFVICVPCVLREVFIKKYMFQGTYTKNVLCKILLFCSKGLSLFFVDDSISLL